jgi:teichuronic acid biosynthesis glycosyltransferase TuaC
MAGLSLDSSMRILTLTNLYPTSADRTFGTFVGDEVKALRRHPRVERCDVLFVDGRSSRWNYASAFVRLARALRRNPVDVVHAHYGLTGVIAATQRRVPTVVTFHTGDLELARWQRALSRQAYRLAADNICVSRRAMERLPGPAHHLTCGVDVDLFTPRGRKVSREAFGVADRELAILFPSSPDRPKKAYPRFERVVKELRRRGHDVHELHLRALSREQVPDLMAAADVMLLTSTQEGSPVAVMEALACGLPIVSTPAGDVPSMLSEAQNARVLEFDTVAFADAAEQLYDGETARRADPVSLRFASTEVTDRLVAILEDACATAPRTGASRPCA